jgi:hypothetical protein
VGYGASPDFSNSLDPCKTKEQYDTGLLSKFPSTLSLLEGADTAGLLCWGVMLP